jgi:hypothetical protein
VWRGPCGASFRQPRGCLCVVDEGAEDGKAIAAPAGAGACHEVRVFRCDVVVHHQCLGHTQEVQVAADKGLEDDASIVSASEATTRAASKANHEFTIYIMICLGVSPSWNMYQIFGSA